MRADTAIGLDTPRTQPRGGLPRPVELILALAGLVLLSPLIGIAALAVALSSRGPVFFRQERVGLRGTVFVILKLRTMRVSNSGPLITAGDDSRITPVGRLLRAAKVDELPQLWNVIRGEMSLVGPRPEVPKYVDFSDPAWRHVLSVRPGITCPVTFSLKHEESLLALTTEDRENFYLRQLQPRKLEGYSLYVDTRSPSSDLKILIETVRIVILRGRRSHSF